MNICDKVSVIFFMFTLLVGERQLIIWPIGYKLIRSDNTNQIAIDQEWIIEVVIFLQVSFGFFGLLKTESIMKFRATLVECHFLSNVWFHFNRLVFDVV